MRRIGPVAAGVVCAVMVSTSVANAGTGWRIQPTPKPPGAQLSRLLAVSCPSTTACIAVGDRVNSGSDRVVTLAERWNGNGWTIQSTPEPAGAGNSQLLGVSCPSTTVCTAVGQYQDSSGNYRSLAQRWNGSRWTIQSIPEPAGTDYSALTGVSCPSTTACTAVGYYFNRAGNLAALAQRWNGSGWTIQATPRPAGSPSSALVGVSCPSGTACTAVGYAFMTSAGVTATLAERWNGTSWTVQSTPNPIGGENVNLTGVSCASTTVCTAVGQYFGPHGRDLTLAERWNGGRWTIQPTPRPAGTRGIELIELSGVSCPSTTACAAVGSYYDSGSDRVVTLAERWNGNGWTIESTPNPTGADVSELNGVSCASSTPNGWPWPSSAACTAVGSYARYSSGDYGPLAERR